jgi:hypothetical protein
MSKKIKLTLAAASLMVALPASAAIYTADFSGLADGATLNGHLGWSVSPPLGADVPDVLAYGAAVNGDRGFQLGTALDAPADSTIVANRAGISGIAFVSTGAQPTVFSTNFALVDSTGVAPFGTHRVSYNISLYGGSTELFTVSFSPNNNTPAGMDDAWGVSFASSQPISYSGLPYLVGEYDDFGTPGDVSDDVGIHNLTATFTQGVGSAVNFSVTIAGATSNTWTGTIQNLALAPLNTVQVGSTRTVDGWGDGVIAIQGLSIVPEPSSALLVGLAGLGLLRRRRTNV